MRYFMAMILLALTASAGAQSLGVDEGVTITHPPVLLRDDSGTDVLSSRAPVSPVQTCGVCHDTDFIASHSYHASVGQNEMFEPGSMPGRRPWEFSPGMYGAWDPLIYRYLTPPGDDLWDLGTADWVRLFGRLHPGGGPAATDDEGEDLTQLEPGSPGTFSFDENDGTLSTWNWRESGTVEFNCFICHLANPDNEARIRALRRGRFKWSATATLEQTGLVIEDGPEWKWIDETFDENGLPSPDGFLIVPPSSNHCGFCHGIVHTSEKPVHPEYGGEWSLSTETKGQIFSPQLLSRSGMNLKGKDHLGVPWDIHAEWLLECAHCHFALNDPAFTTKWGGSGRGLYFDGRRLGIDEFLTTPDHNFAKGRSAHGTVAENLDGTMRRCEGCHSVEHSHEWLPYKRRHMDRLLCEVCHIPAVRAPARSVTDWTVITRAGGPRVEYRGVNGKVSDPAALVSGYRPLLLPRQGQGDEDSRLAPHNLIASWYWVHGDPPRPVRLFDLRRAFLRDGSYHPDVVSALDASGDGTIDETELLLDTPSKVEAVRERLAALGLIDLRIAGEIQPYSLHHGVATGKWAERRCDTCHMKDSEMSRPFLVASAAPGGVMPAPVKDTNAQMIGDVTVDEGRLYYMPVSTEGGFYILGHDRWLIIDMLGAIVVAGAFALVAVHGGIRVILARSRRSSS